MVIEKTHNKKKFRDFFDTKEKAIEYRENF